MSLPPVPGNSLPPPPPPPPPPPASGAGPQLSRRALAWIGGGFAALVAIIIIAARLEAPTDSAVKSFVIAQLKQEGFAVEDAWVNRQGKSDKTVTYSVRISFRRSTEQLYEALLPEIAPAGGGVPSLGGVRGAVNSSLATSLPDWLPIDIPAWQLLRLHLSNPNSQRLRQAAGLTPEDEALVSTTVVRELKDDPRSASNLNTTEGTVRAKRRGLLWDYTLERSWSSDQGSGSRRLLAGFRGKVLVLERVEDRAALLDLAHRLPTISTKLARATAVLQEENKTRWLALLKPQALFAGTAEIKYQAGRPRVFLEITEVRGDEDPPRLSALLRNDGGWTETRLFSGAMIYEPGLGAFQLKLSSPSRGSEGEENNYKGAGPFLEDQADGFNLETDQDGDRVLPLTIEGNALLWNSGNTTLRLEPVRAESRATLMAESQGDYPQLIEATKSGMIYTGAITSKAKGTKENWNLSFTKQETPDGDEPSGIDLEAILEHPEHRTWKGTLEGHVEANRYRAKELPVRLEYREGGGEFSPPKEFTDIFERRNENDFSEDNSAAMRLRLEGSKLVGENPRFVFRFERAPPELVAERERQQTAREAQMLAFIQPGAIHEGTVERTGLASSGNLRLRFVESDEQPGPAAKLPRAPRHAGLAKKEDSSVAVKALLYSPSRPWFAYVLTGQCDVGHSLLKLRFASASGWAMESLSSAPDLKPYLDDFSSYNAELTLVLDQERAEGASGLQNPRLSFRFQASRPDRLAQLQKQEADREATMLAFVQPGAIHDGTVQRDGLAAPAAVRLRVAEPSDRPKRTAGRLRPPGRVGANRTADNDEQVELELYSPSRPRFFARLSGKCNVATGVMELQVEGSPSWPAGSLADDPELAPHFREAMNYGSKTMFFIEGERVAGTASSRSNESLAFQFQPSTPDRLAQLQKLEAGREAKMQAFVQVGAIHEGTIQAPGLATSARVRLRMVKGEARDQKLEAVLESAERPRFSSRLTGQYDPAKHVVGLEFAWSHDSATGPLSDDPDVAPHISPASGFPQSSLSNERLGLFLDGEIVAGIPQGAAQTPVLRFQPSSPERLALLQKADTDRDARLLDLFRAGASYEGTVKHANAVSGSVRLRIVKFENRGATVEAILESVQHPETGWLLKGKLQLAGRTLKLTTSGSSRQNVYIQNDPLLPDLNMWSSDLLFIVEKDALTGSVGSSDSATKLSFPLGK